MKTAFKDQEWTGNSAIIKRMLDILVALIILFLFLPLFGVISVLVLVDLGWPFFYSQERMGKHGTVFKIIKFRTMPKEAEQNGPQLASDEDERATPLGKKLRKWRLDELPQFFNVLLGDMSIVGPRPEREFYLKQIEQQLPEYRYLLNVRPGITSKGMVKYGYASTVDQMIDRAKYDLDYLKNLSFKNDLRVLLETIIVITEGSGK
ncbi:MAG: sugar transferase [Saprospiraceae bacterium]|nr:sugar transferase [Saprospiraceae bacterium]